MECPFCNYKEGEYDYKKKKKIGGKEGDFFKLSNDVEMIRRDEGSYTRTHEKRNIYGCPKCKKIFMDNWGW